jgi:transcription antitermination factor NusG
MEGIKRELRAVTFMPTRCEEIQRGGVTRMISGKTVFPRYLFLGVDGDPDRCWFRLRYICGVQNILFMDGKPFCVRPSVVADLMTACERGVFDKRPEPLATPFAAGDKVRIVGGPYYSFFGKIGQMHADDDIGSARSAKAEKKRLTATNSH